MFWVVVVVMLAQGREMNNSFAEPFTISWSALNFTIPSNTTFALGDQLSESPPFARMKCIHHQTILDGFCESLS